MTWTIFLLRLNDGTIVIVLLFGSLCLHNFSVSWFWIWDCEARFCSIFTQSWVGFPKAGFERRGVCVWTRRVWNGTKSPQGETIQVQSWTQLNVVHMIWRRNSLVTMWWLFMVVNCDLHLPCQRPYYCTVSVILPHFCALPNPISHTLVWEILGRDTGRDIVLARAFPRFQIY
jgi:hypothetical protein